LSLVNGFDKRFPRSAEIPDVYFFAAQMLCENLRRDEKARHILAMLLERYPEHPVAGKSRQLLNVLDKMAVRS
jgi:TolA-binding protein